MISLTRFVAPCMDGTRLRQAGRSAATISLMLAAAAVASSASAALVVSFPSQSVDAVAGTSVTALLSVAATTNESIATFQGQFNIVKSDVNLPDITLASANLTGLTTPAFTAGNPNPGVNSVPAFFITTDLSANSSLVASNTYQLMNLVMTIPATPLVGTYTLNFLTTGQNVFTDNIGTPISYTNGTNGTTLGVIAVPEASGTVLLASGAFVVGGAGLARRRTRSRKAGGSAEIAG